ncbi:hypothetical protein [Alkalimarinus coralli]|uniref:hypothetical protein n=1 Tax=Alkalimarinus coralli TaxID=2935863 RepID=UPI00202B29AC|nr:hypothetical protein [Alkalimarinus coralli]
MKFASPSTRLILAASLFSALIGCASNESMPSNAESQSNAVAEPKTVVAVDANNDELYEVHHDGRIYIFDDYTLYQNFNKLGHTPYILARIGAGPKGETIKFGLTSKDKKKQSGIASVDLYDGKLAPAENFYGEMRSEGRIYVFSTLQDMNDVRKIGEASYRFTDIGAGPKGETVVYVLNKSNKKKKPVALMEAFKKRNSQG